jgi:hypothetical protein
MIRVLGYTMQANFVRKWRNWQTRTAQDRMGQPLGVQISSSAPYYFKRPALFLDKPCVEPVGRDLPEIIHVPAAQIYSFPVIPLGLFRL